MSTYWIEPTLHPEILRSVEMEAETEEEPDELVERSARPGIPMRKTNLLLGIVLSVVLAIGQTFAADPPAGAKLPGGELSIPEYVDFVASEHQAASRIFAINDTMMANYDDMRNTIAKRLSPIIVAHFDGIGGTFTLQYKGRRRTVSPSPPQYAELKSISHLPMGIYVIIAPYFKSPQERGWQEKLAEYRAKVKAGLDTIEQTDLTGASKQDSKLILTESIKYIKGIMKAGTFDVAGFEAYSQMVLPAIKANLYRAARLQAEASVHLLQQWRTEIGEEDWKKLWGVALAPFTLSVKNASWQAMYLEMNCETRDDQLLLIANTNDFEYSLETVAHLIMDRLLARLVFSEKTGADRELVKALSSKQDLVGDATERALKSILKSGAAADEPKGEFARTTVDIGITVSDMEKSAKFYTEAIGFTEQKGFSVPGDFTKNVGLTTGQKLDFRVFKLGEDESATGIKLTHVPGAKSKKVDHATIQASLGVSFLTIFVNDTTAALARLKKFGAKPIGKGTFELPKGLPQGVYMSVVRDPDGNLIELIGPKKNPCPPARLVR